MPSRRLIAALIGLALTGELPAQQITWVGPSSGDWSTGSNWSTGAVPGPGSTVLLQGALGTPQSPIATDVAIASSAVAIEDYSILIFHGSASAGSATYSLLGVTPPSSPGATYNGIQFLDASTAGNASIAIDGRGTPSSTPFTHSVVLFNGTASAAQSRITVTNEAQINFAGSSTAGDATITNNARGLTSFVQNASAGNATIINNDGGITAFFSSSNSSGATIVSNAGGEIDVRAGRVVSIGSLSGAGAVYLGNGQLTVGALNRNDTIDGVVQDGYSAAFSSYLTSLGLTPGTPTGGRLVKVGAGTLYLTAQNTYSGGTTIAGGVVNIGNDASLGAPVGALTLDGGALQLGADVTVARPVTLTANNGTIDTQGFTGTVSTAIAGGGSLTKRGTGVLTLLGDNTYSGGTTIAAGTVQVGNGGTSGSLIGDVANNGAFAFNRSDTLVFPGMISGFGTVSQLGSGTTILTGDSAYTGGTTIAAGKLQLGNGGASGSLAGDVVDHGVLAFDRSDTLTFAGNISGNGQLHQLGSGSTVLTGENTYTGGTRIAAGTLQLGNGGTRGSLAGDVADGGTLVFNRADNLIFAGLISDLVTANIDPPGAVVQAGNGTTILTADNTYTGGTTIAAGTLQLGDGGTHGGIVGDVVDNGTLRFDRSDTVTFPGVVSGSGDLVQQGSGTTILNASHSYTGETTVAVGTLAVGDASHASAALGGGGTAQVAPGAVLGGYGSTAGDVVNHGTLAVANALNAFSGNGLGGFAVGGTLTNAALVQLAGHGVGNRLVAGSYLGQSGRIAMNTVLAGDGAPSDVLVINGGNASGQTTLDIVNAGGLGAATPGNGILVVSAINGARTTGDAFTLGSRLVAGPYQYTLFQGTRDATSPQSWYLRSQLINPPPVTPPAPVTPNYRPEVSLYAALPSMALNYGVTLIGTLHERVGEEEQRHGQAGQQAGPSGIWARVIGQDGEWDAKPGGIYRDGPSFDDNLFAVQAGMDLYRAEQNNGNHDYAGLLATVGHGHGDAIHDDLTSAGTNRFDAYSFGGYWTHFGANGWYVDGVLQGTWYDAKATSHTMSDLRTNGFGFTASLEGGYPYKLHDGWSLEPQAQVIYQTLDMDDSHDTAATVRFHDADSLTARLGARLSNTWARGEGRAFKQVTGWLVANVWHEFNADARTSFSSTDGFVPFHSDLTGSWGELEGGMSAQLSDRASLYGTLSYQKGFDRGVRAFAGNIGVRLNW